MEGFKTIKNQRKSVLTRHCNTLTRLLEEQDADGINDRLRSMKLTMEQLEQAHYDYLDCVQSNTSEDEDEISKCDAWFEGISRMYLENVHKARCFLDQRYVAPSTGKVTQDSNESSSASASGLSAEFVTLLSLPRVDIPKFNGDPCEYQTFITIFDQVIGDIINDDQVKLTRLLQYMTGDAAIALRSCALIGGSSGYAQAREVLKSRIGSSHLVAQRVINDLRNGKTVSSAAEVRKLADDLTTAYQILSKIGANMYSEVNNQHFIQDILTRCHPQVRNRWRKFALDNFELKREYPDFKQFVTFTEKLAREACDPVYGYEAMKTTRVNFVSDYSKSPSLLHDRCVACKGSHSLTQCGQFKAMRPYQRLQLVRRNHLCFGCLSKSHMLATCDKSRTCNVDGCNRKHSVWLHMNQVRSYTQYNVNGDEGGRSPNVVTGSVNSCMTGNRVYLPLVTVLVNGHEPAVALLDTGSTNTFITERLASKLSLQGKSVTCRLSTLGSKLNLMTEHVTFDVSPLNDDVTFNVQNVCVIPDIPADVPAYGISLDDYPHFAGLPLSPVTNAKVDLLIGQDQPDFLVPLEICRSLNKAGQPYATRTKLGWALQGPVDQNIGSNACMANSHIQLEQLNQKVENLWNIDNENESTLSWSGEDQRVYDMWQDKTELNDNRYTVPIPWRPGRPCFPNNRYSADKRLESTLKKLNKTGMYEVYNENMQKLVRDGHAELVPNEQLGRDDGAVWYLPHHAVLSGASSKLRIVFDCAAEYQGVSLNKECFQGPDLCNKLVHVLLRFRLYQNAMTADIQAMYLQVRIPEQERDCLRFLWLENGEVKPYRMTSHLFGGGGVWCASSTTYALRRTLDDAHASPMVRDVVSKSIYVDDLLQSTSDRSIIEDLVRDVKATLSKGGFLLTKFIVNDPDLLQQIPEGDRAKEAKVITHELHSKALGIKWDVSSYQLMYVRKEVEPVTVVTERFMLSSVSTMYYPLGLVLPVVIRGRMLFQQATKLKLDWDDPLPPELTVKWVHWWNDLKNLSTVLFDRCVIPTEFLDGAIELHHFCDGSQQAYGACSYVRISSTSGLIHVQLLAAKARLTPLSVITIPRIELCSAVMAVKADEVLRNELGLDLLPSTCWSDSKVALSYIRCESHRLRVFVANRVVYVRSNTAVDQWKYVPTGENPTDVLSRGCSPNAMPKNVESRSRFSVTTQTSLVFRCSYVS